MTATESVHSLPFPFKLSKISHSLSSPPVVVGQTTAKQDRYAQLIRLVAAEMEPGSSDEMGEDPKLPEAVATVLDLDKVKLINSVISAVRFFA